MVSSEYWFGAEAGFYNGVATQSLRINDGHTLTKLFSSPTSTTTMSFGGWLKFSNETYMNIFSQGTGGGGVVQAFLRLDSSYRLNVDSYDGSSYYFNYTTNRVLRDKGAWYHIWVQIDSTDATQGDRVKIYVNGVRETSFSAETQISSQGSAVIGWNTAVTHYIGYTSANFSFDGYIADWYFLDGQDVSPIDTVGEFKNGIFIPKEYSSATFGNNGFHLKFIGTGTATSSGSVATPTNIGDDSSGQNNHWTVTGSGITSHDANLPDSPENNWCTMNSLINGYNTNITMSEGNLAGTATSGQYNNTLGTILMTSGKWYWEISSSDFNNYIMLGIAIETAIQTTDSTPYGQTGVVAYATHGQVYNETASSTGSYSSFLGSEIIGIAVDLDSSTKTFKFYNNNTLQDTINLSSNFDDIGILPFFCIGTADTIKVNFGQDSSFAGLKTAQGNQDENSIGDFYYTPPSGYLALCSSNLPEPTIGANSNTQPTDHFDALLYNGTGSDNLDISGLSFQPDLIWKKSRDENVRNTWTDSNRGVGKDLFSDLDGTESPDTNNIKEFRSDGFRLGTSTNGNVSGIKYVSWNWLAGGTTPTKTYKVVVVSDSGNKYRFRNSADDATFAQSAVTLNLQELGTYTFDLSDSSMSGHPFVFSTTSDGTHGGGSEYTTGVTKTGTAGSAGASIVITVASSAPTLYYYCSNHSGMGGQVNTNATHGSTNFDGNILSVSNVNETSGFGIVTYTGINGATTVGHGLGKIPAMVIVKQRDNASTDWIIGHQKLASSAFANNKFLKFDRGNGTFTNSAVFGATPTTTAIQLTTTTAGNLSQASTDFVMYCFAEVEGFSKMGTYVTNAVADGTFVYTGFKPAFVMVRVIDGSSNSNYWSWTIHDNARKISNVRHSPLYANLYRPEPYRGDDSTSTGGADVKMDFYSNGFKDKSGATEQNGVAGTNIIYMAFSSSPFKYANAE